MSDNKFEVKAACSNCEATGLYVGMGERSGFAVVCHTCKGTGEVTLKFVWNEFKGRKLRDDVKRVLRVNPGICVGTDEDAGLTYESFGGLTYRNWDKGKEFPEGSEDRDHTCPAWFYQSADYERKPNWNECLGAGTFSSCKNWCNKSECWKRFDDEDGAKP